SENPPVKRLLLFDDVATTGASLQALGHALSSQSTGLSVINSKNSHQYHLSAYALAHGSQLYNLFLSKNCFYSFKITIMLLLCCLNVILLTHFTYIFRFLSFK